MPFEDTVKAVGAIRFTVFSPSDIRKYSVTEITAPETYDEDGMPVQGGLMDHRLGTLEPGQKCGTCGNTAARCPGHFGHVELAESVLHIAFVDDIHKLLLSTCRSCGRALIPQDEIDTYKQRLDDKSSHNPNLGEIIRKEIIAAAKKTVVCPHCGKQKYEIEYTKPTVFYEVTEGGGATRLLPVAIRERLEKLIDDDLIVLGYNPEHARPEWFVLQVLPVPPVSVRPSITLESGIRSEDDLTHKVVDILRVNQRVRESKDSGTPPLIVQDLVDLLQYHVITFFDNEVSGMPQAHHRSGRPLKTLSQRLKGKEGRFRGNLSGKRVDFSCRTVISPDPSLNIADVGVPFEIARRMTVPEKVSTWNIDYLKGLVLKGPDNHPGANYIIRPDGVKIRLDYVTEKQAIADTLVPGFIVERHIIDGDVVIFNRQPSLHRMSVMAHFVKVLPYRTFRLHPAICPPYNADFDGDEMNLHVPQSEEARSEALTLMKVQGQILSPRYGGPIVGAIRDFLTAAYLLTREGNLLTEDEFTDLALIGGYTGTLPSPVVQKKVPMYNGRQLLSLILPKDLNYVVSSKWGSALDNQAKADVVIKDGELISGIIDRASIGAEEPDSVLHRIAKDYGSETTRTFLNSITSILKTYITRIGFSYGYDELVLDKKAESSVRKGLDDSYAKVEDYISQYKKGDLQVARGLSQEDALEAYIVNELAKARDKVGRIADNGFPLDNSGVIMARTGARGSSLNIGQMTAALGQQSVRGKRIEKGYSGRALSHFPQGDVTPDAKGFVKSNYRDGLSPSEFFFHAMGGREGLVDTAVRTQQSGYMQRRLINALEHLRVEYDHTVRDSHGHIIEFLYGEDGVDPAKSDHGKSVNVERLAQIEVLLNESKTKIPNNLVEKMLKKYEEKLNLRLVEDLRTALQNKKLTPKSVEIICQKTVELLDKAQVEPGEASGIIAAQSIGEPGTQMTLRTFHFAGVKERDVTLGLPRLIELVDARKVPSKPTMDVKLTKEYKNSNEKALKVAREILFTKVSDLVEYSEIDFDGSVRLVLSKNSLKDRSCTPEMVSDTLKTGKRKVELDEKNGVVKISLEGADLPATFAMRNKVLNVRVKGITGIVRVTVVQDNDEWIIQTTGSNLQKVLQIEGVDIDHTMTNSIFEIVNTLGIEAGRTALVKEIMTTLDEQGLEVDIRHIALVSDLMCSKGILQQIGRHGIAGTKSSVLARAAFEITVPTLAAAAVRGGMEEETLRGVTENIIVGLPVPVGTGMIDVFMRRKSSG